MSHSRDQLITSEKELRQLEEQHRSEKNPSKRKELLKTINLKDSIQNRKVAEYLLEHDSEYAVLYHRNVNLFNGNKVEVSSNDMFQTLTLTFQQYTYGYTGKVDEKGSLQLSDSKKNNGFFRDAFFLGKYPLEYRGYINGFGKVAIQVSKFKYGFILYKKPVEIALEINAGVVSGRVMHYKFTLLRTLTPKMKVKNLLQGESLKEFNQNREIMMEAILNFREILIEE
ncbi:hypothetical protein GYB22_07385 [bacterium]|nr:hypothetical protein [bacterium]